MPENRQKNGQFGKGNCANPGGRPKKLAVLVEACQEMTDEILERLRDIVLNGKQSNAIKASEIILAYGFGKPTQAVEVTGAEGEPLFPTPRIPEMTREEWLEAITQEQSIN